MIDKLDKNIIDFVKTHLNDDTHTLALMKSNDAFNFKFALNQISSRKKLKDKMPDWWNNFDLIFPESISIEQSSSVYTAYFKAELLNYNKSIDLTSGFGIDSFFISNKSQSHTLVELNTDLINIVEYNFNKLRIKNCKFINSSAEEFLQSNNEFYDLIFIDPSRRVGDNGKIILIENSEPNLIKIQNQLLNKCRYLMVKLSPMLDISYIIDKIPFITNLYAISFKNELKEIVLIIENNRQFENFHAIDLDENNIKSNYVFAKIEQNVNSYSDIKSFLYEPNNCIMKFKAFNNLLVDFPELTKLHPNTHLFTSDMIIDNFPGKIYKVIKEFKVDFKEFKKYYKEDYINIKVRNFSLSPEMIQKKIKLKDGGSKFLFALTVLPNQHKLILCEKY